MWLSERWVGPVDRAALEVKIKSGKYGIRDMWLWKTLTGVSEPLLKQAADKMCPDQAPVDKDGEALPLIIIDRSKE